MTSMKGVRQISELGYTRESGIQGQPTPCPRPPVQARGRLWAPASRLSGNLKYPSFRGSGAAREPGTQEHKPLPTWESLVFIGSGPGPTDHPGMTKKQAPTEGISFRGGDGKRRWGSSVSFAPVASRDRGRGLLIFQPRRE